MTRAIELQHTINPYSRWIYDHPACLFPHPTPALLAEQLGGSSHDGTHRPRRRVVDLGCGSGNFLMQLALQHLRRAAGDEPLVPRTDFIGFELRYKRLVKAARKLERERLTNVWLLRESAERFAAYFGADSVDALYVNFPDPWPKYGHWKKRLVNPVFLDDVERVLKPGGAFHLKTDHSGYFLHVLSRVRDRKNLSIQVLTNDMNRYGAPDPHVRSEFEALFRSKRKPIFYLVMEKARSTG